MSSGPTKYLCDLRMIFLKFGQVWRRSTRTLPCGRTFFPPGTIFGAALFGRWKQAEDRTAADDLLLGEFLITGRLIGFGSNLCGIFHRKHHHTFVIADDDIARIDRDARASDRKIEVGRVMDDRTGGR